MGNDGNEFKIITQTFLYKFLNDKFICEVKKIDKKLAKLRAEMNDLEAQRANKPYPAKPIRTAGYAPEEDDESDGTPHPQEPLRKERNVTHELRDELNSLREKREQPARTERKDVKPLREKPEVREPVERKKQPEKKSATEALKDGDKK